MDRDRQRLLWIAAVVLALTLVVVLVVMPARERLAPQPLRALVAVEAEGEGVARNGSVELPAGTPFRLHAVLEARTARDESVYYTRATALEIDGEPIPAERVLPWGRADQTRVHWFTLEGLPPYVSADDGEAVASFQLQEVFRSDWPQAWSIPGTVVPTTRAAARGVDEHGPLTFGTAAYQARVLLYGPESQIRPRERYASAGVTELAADPEAATRVTLSLDDPLGPVSRAFGLAQLEPGRAERIPDRLQPFLDAGVAFRRAQVLAATAGAAGMSWEALSWRPLDLAAGPPWGDAGAGPGDLVRSGGRIVILYRDQGDGRLGWDDQVFDLFRGAAVRALRQVYAGGGLLEWAPLRAVEPNTP